MMSCSERRFLVAYKNNFICQFCNAKVDHNDIEIDHMVPTSMGGSNNLENLTCACKKCNRTKSSVIAFPRSICEGPDSVDPDWTVLRSFGKWQIKWHAKSGIVAEHTPRRYWVNAHRAYSSRLFEDMMAKVWFTSEEQKCFRDAIAYLQLFIMRPKERA